MVYQQSLAIEERLQQVLALIRAGGHSTPTLAVSLAVSVPTISRCIAALRNRGFVIECRRTDHGCHYVLRKSTVAGTSKRKLSRISKHPQLGHTARREG